MLVVEELLGTCIQEDKSLSQKPSHSYSTHYNLDFEKEPYSPIKLM